MVLKILTVLFALVALRRVVVRYHKGGSFVELCFWSLVFAGIGVVVFFPSKTDGVAQWVGVSSGFNLLTFVAVSMLLLAVYRLIGRVNEQERTLTRLVRAEAIANATQVPPEDAVSTPQA